MGRDSPGRVDHGDPVSHFPLPLRGEFRDRGRRVCLTEPFAFVFDGHRIDIPAGFVTDFNSTPRMVWWWFPPQEYPEAGLVHDWLYQHPGEFSRQQCDDVHRHILKLEGMRESKRNAAYAGLRLGGWRPWNRYRKAELIAPKDCDDV